MKPFVKWAGGKRQILERIKGFITASLDGKELDSIKYYEPFLGGGAVLFDLQPKKAVVNDLNADLINAYKVIQSDDVEDLIAHLEEYQCLYREEDRDELYYETRAMDRTNQWNRMTPVEKAARMIFLNRTCYNGLYRVNSLGQFNTPIGRYRNPLICDKENLLEIHEYLKSNKIQIINKSYEECIRKAGPGDIIYVDPPYDYEDDDGFTKYQMNGFTFKDFESLKKECDKALKRGAYVIISNNATDRVIKLFLDDPNYKVYTYDMNKFETLRSINCKGDSRKTGLEVIFWGIPTLVPIPQANDIKKVIKLAMAENENIYSDKKAVAEYLALGTERQASYYLSALKFFKYLTNNYELTDLLISLRADERKLVQDMKKQLFENDDVKYLIEHNMFSVDDIAKYLSGTYKNIGDVTARRRASTIKAWINWIKE